MLAAESRSFPLCLCASVPSSWGIILFASTAQYRVKPYLIAKLRQAEHNKHLLRTKEGSLGIEDAQEAVYSLCIPLIGEAVAFG